MSLEETLGEGYKQVLAGLGAFLVGAIWGATGEMSISGMYIPLVIMMLGALVAILGMSLGGAGGAHGESFDLKSAMDDMAGLLTELQEKVTGGDDSGDGGDDSGDGGDDSGDGGE
ncbi:hypothetical protein OAJ94_04545 [Deltaproteobacteria bacterium]|nr:hypothetical protein [Deltaproteobacteria bacterium]